MYKLFVLVAVVASAYGGVISGPAASSHSSITQHTVSQGYGAAPAYKVAVPAYNTYAAPAYKVAAPVAHYAAPIAKAVVAEQYSEPHYDFSYAVNDPHTGDVKEQQESRKGDAVHGFYSLIEADGTKRIVEYTADDHNGFNAVVRREGNAHPVAVKTVAPVYKTVAAAPVAVKYAAAPVAVKYAAPAVAYQHAAPAVAYQHAAPAVAYQHAAPVAVKYASAPAATFVSFSGPTHSYQH